jgi:glutathione peroxidase
MSDIYNIQVETIHGQQQFLSEYKDRVLLIVNVASKCGFTKQYLPLEQLYRTYKQQGLVVLGFPCNQFAGQEPGENAAVEQHVTSCFAVSFPLVAKIDVKGAHQSPLYRYLGEHLQQKVYLKNVPWNFTKYLVNQKGQVVHRYLPFTSMKRVEADIQSLLGVHNKSE